jgi:hypothetical protein
MNIKNVFHKLKWKKNNNIYNINRGMGWEWELLGIVELNPIFINQNIIYIYFYRS